MSDKHKKDFSIEVLVGFFMFLILVALGIFTVVLSRDNFFQKKYPLIVLFDEVGGLREGDHVFLRGTKVGVVRATMLNNDHVAVRADLDVEVHFREGYRVEVADASMLGGKLLKIYEGPLTAGLLAPDTVITGAPPMNVLAELGSAVTGIKRMTEQVSAGEGTLGKLIQDDSMYERLLEISSSLQQVAVRLERGEGTIGRLLADDAVYEDIKSFTGDLRELSGRLVDGRGTLGRLLNEDDSLYEDLSGAMADIRSIIRKLEEGEGTLGKLVNDDELYREAKQLLAEVRAAVDDMRENSPVTTFSTILFGAF